MRWSPRDVEIQRANARDRALDTRRVVPRSKPSGRGADALLATAAAIVVAAGTRSRRSRHLGTPAPVAMATLPPSSHWPQRPRSPPRRGRKFRPPTRCALGVPAPRAETQLVRRREDAKDARFLGCFVSRTSLTRSTSSRWLPRINNTEATTTLSLYVEAARFGKPDIFFYDALCRRNVKKRKEYIAAKRAFREVATAFRRHRSVA